MQREGLPIKSTGYEVLVSHLDNELVRGILRYRELAKLKSTYITPILELPTFPVVHATFNQVGTDTTRLSCKEPNLQNIPNHSEDGRKIRKAYVPRESKKLIIADYSQIDLRCMAHFSHDAVMMDAYINEKDLHQIFADRYRFDRFLGKTCNFLLGYSGGPFRLMQEILEQTEGKRRLTEDEAQIAHDAWHEMFAGYWRWNENHIAEVRRTGGVVTVNGWFIPAPLPSYKDLEKAVVNWRIKGEKTRKPTMTGLVKAWERETTSKKISGSAADIITLAHNALGEAGYLPLISVHDELVCEVDTNIAEVAAKEINQIMTNVIKLDVPLKVGVYIGSSWAEKA